MNWFWAPVVAAFAVLQAPVAPSAPLTIDQAAAIAERNAFSVRLQQANVRISRASLRGVVASTGPQITVNGSYTRSGNAVGGFSGLGTGATTGGVTTGGTTGTTAGATTGTTAGATTGATAGATTGTAGGTTAGTTGATTGATTATTSGSTTGGTNVPTTAFLVPADTTLISASITLPIDVSGQLRAQVASARSGLQASEQTLQASFNDARLNARTAFLNVLRQQALVAVNEQAVRDAQTTLRQAQLQLQQVQIAKIDVNRLDAQVAQATTDLINSRNNLDLARYTFNVALARPVDTPVNLVDVTTLPNVAGNPDAFVRTALQARPEGRSVRATVEANRASRIATERSLLPTLGLSLSGNRYIGATSAFAQNNATLGLNLSFPLFDSGVRRSRVLQAQAVEAQAQVNLQQTELAIAQDVRNALANLASAQARYVNAQRQVELAQEVFRLAQVRQNAGEGTYVEVVDAETSLAQARNSQVSARYDYLLAYSQLQRAVGIDTIASTATAPAGATTGGTE